MKNVTTFALTAALATGLASAAFAGTVTETSNTWKPGFSLVDGGSYERTVHVDRDTSYNATLKNVVVTEQSDTAKVGFTAVGGNRYERSYVVKNQNVESKAELSDSRSTWAPGYFLDESGSFVKL
ncbi:MAG: hypothetical protein HWE30_00410 [Methylocystaceae bacterium]|nr:hypothetical protein [Methylocystaceae bacterium]